MIQPIGHYTSYSPGDNSLLEYIQETYGPFCEGITVEEKFFLIYYVAHGLSTLFHREGIRDEIAILAMRMTGELNIPDQEGVLEALVVQARLNY